MREKLRDVVGLYLDPPHNAAVFSFDEKRIADEEGRLRHHDARLQAPRNDHLLMAYRRRAVPKTQEQSAIAGSELGHLLAFHPHQRILGR